MLKTIINLNAIEFITCTEWHIDEWINQVFIVRHESFWVKFQRVFKILWISKCYVKVESNVDAFGNDTTIV